MSNFSKNSVRIAIVMPRGMNFSPDAATSIDLCVRDFVSYSAFAESTAIFCEKTDNPFSGFNIFYHPQRNYRKLQSNLIEFRPDIVVVHQHQPTAARISKYFKNIPILLHKHNFVKHQPGMLRHLKHTRRYQALAGIIFVSSACREDFQTYWKNLRTPLHVLHNGLDFDAWSPKKEREKTILFVGRLSPDKGVLDLVKAARNILPSHPDWTLRLIYNEVDKYPDYKREVLRHCAYLTSQVEILENQTFETVKSHTENAGIAVVPSKFEEPFGRTAIEAFAGGAALVTSGTGGLIEVVGDAAIILPNMSVESLGDALSKLIGDASLRETLSREGLLRGKNLYSIQAISSKLDDIYSRHLSSPLWRSA